MDKSKDEKRPDTADTADATAEDPSSWSLGKFLVSVENTRWTRERDEVLVQMANYKASLLSAVELGCSLIVLCRKVHPNELCRFDFTEQLKQMSDFRMLKGPLYGLIIQHRVPSGSFG